VSENQVMDQLANPRNKAAHGGSPLDPKLKQCALVTARKIVSTAAPLPAPNDCVNRPV
jgi:hypothetical protein